MNLSDFDFILADGIAGAAALGPDFVVLRRSGRLSHWLPEVGHSCFESEFLTGLQPDFEEQRRDLLAEPLILPEMRMMVGRISEKITIFIRWDAAQQVFVVLTTRDQMARPIDEWMARRAREQRILEEKIAEQAQELVRINQDLMLSNTQLKQFSAVAAHDLQSPLRQVSAFARLLSQRPGVRIDLEAVDYIATMDASLNRMQSMVASLLHYARLSARSYVFDDVDMRSVVAAARQNLSGLERETGARIEIGPLPDALGDGILLIQVWQNLIANSLHYRSALAPVVHISGMIKDGMVEYSLRDNGCGISRADAQSVFEMFRRGASHPEGEALQSETHGQGSGIGLSLCLRIVEIHGGRIWFDTDISIGSRVYFTLPLLFKAAFAEKPEHPSLIEQVREL